METSYLFGGTKTSTVIKVHRGYVQTMIHRDFE